jgi:signal transduction histidine kinase
MSLRLRLILSYFLVVAVTLVIIVIAFLLFLPTRPAPPQPTYQRLSGIAQTINFASLIRDLNPIINPDARRDALEAELLALATDRDIRVMLIDVQQNLVTYDSNATYATGQTIAYRADVYSLPAVWRRGVFTQVEAIFGGFPDPDGEEWLFVALEAVRRGNVTEVLVFADRRGVQSLQESLEGYTRDLLLVLVQAGVFGAAAAIILATLVSRTLARPLQALALAAKGMAGGNYAERVPLTGPQEIREVADSFNNMGAQVQAAQNTQQEFLANVSHDLKTPLTSIQGYSQAIMDGAAADTLAAARIIHEEAGRLNRMVVELTDLARLQAGRLSLRWSQLELGGLTAAIAERLAIMAQEKQITLHVNTHRLPEVVGDGDRLAQVLTNLISNAIKYTPMGGHIWVTTALSAGGVEVKVKDTGIGIPKNQLPRIFERFYQVDKARGPRRGTGLGLAIALEIAEAHSGRIMVDSEGEGKGATFTLWLPSSQMSTILRKK